jgi:hypothetical protein
MVVCSSGLPATIFAGLAIALAGTWGRTARAADRPAAAPRQADVSFRSGEVDVDADLATLQLRKDVVVTVDRYRLSSECLQLRRGPIGIELSGEGEMSLCRCAGAPVKIGLESAIVAPPTDLLIRNPVLEVGGVPIGWAPVVWLRSRERAGMTPMRVAWRGEDGAYLDSGVHLPVGPAGSRSTRSVDLRAGGYLKGGVVVGGQLQTPSTTTAVAWDHLHGADALNLVSHGTTGPSDRASIAWRGNWSRGARARRTADELSVAAERWDQGTVGATVTGWRGVMALQARQIDARGGPWSSLGSAGPALVAGGTTIFARGFQLQGNGGLWTTQADGATRSWATGEGSVGGSIRPGITRVDLALDSAMVARVADGGSSVGAAVSATGRAGVPLVRQWPNSVVHQIDPFLQVTASDRRSKLPVGVTTGTQSKVRAVGGLSSSIENRRAAGAASIELSGGTEISAGTIEPLAQLRAVADHPLLAIGTTAQILSTDADSWALTGRGRLGRSTGWRLDAWADGLGSGVHSPLAATASTSTLLGDRSLASTGWSGGTGATVPFARWLAASVGGDADLTSRQWTAARLGLMYRHSCGCLAVGSRGLWRLAGRGAVVDVTVDLMP